MTEDERALVLGVADYLEAANSRPGILPPMGCVPRLREMVARDVRDKATEEAWRQIAYDLRDFCK